MVLHLNHLVLGPWPGVHMHTAIVATPLSEMMAEIRRDVWIDSVRGHGGCLRRSDGESSASQRIGVFEESVASRSSLAGALDDLNNMHALSHIDATTRRGTEG